MEHLKLIKENKIAILTIDRPDFKNALNAQSYDEFGMAVEEVKKDLDIRVLILTGAGDSFCAGVDLSYAATLKDHTQLKFKQMLEDIQHTFSFEKLNIPVIAAVKGYALGNGCDIAMACDFIIAAENAKFCMAYINLGLIPDIGGTYRLPKLVGPSKAKELILTGERIDAKEAHKIGLVGRVVPDEKLMDETMEFANKLAKRSPVALALAKKAINKSVFSDLDKALELESHIQQLCALSQDATEAAMANFEKRDPNFTGN